MTAAEYIILGILGAFAVVVGLVALLADPKGGRAEGNDGPALLTHRDDHMCSLAEMEDEARQYEQAKQRREARDRAWTRHRAIYAPRKEAHIRRARKEP